MDADLRQLLKITTKDILSADFRITRIKDFVLLKATATTTTKDLPQRAPRPQRKATARSYPQMVQIYAD